MPIGYDKVGLNQELLLNLKFVEGTGLITHDWAKPNHENPLLVTPAWYQLANGKNYLDFDDTNPDWIEITGANSADLNFTIGDYSVGCWVYFDTTLGGMLMIRGLASTDGWYLYIDGSDGKIYFGTNQAGARQLSYSNDDAVELDGWYLVVATRDGADVSLYSNGIDVTELQDTHVNPLTSARKFLIGVDDDEASETINGKVGEVWIWDRELTPADVKQLYELTRGEYE